MLFVLGDLGSAVPPVAQMPLAKGGQEFLNVLFALVADGRRQAGAPFSAVSFPRRSSWGTLQPAQFSLLTPFVISGGLGETPGIGAAEPVGRLAAKTSTAHAYPVFVRPRCIVVPHGRAKQAAGKCAERAFEMWCSRIPGRQPAATAPTSHLPPGGPSGMSLCLHHKEEIHGRVER